MSPSFPPSPARSVGGVDRVRAGRAFYEADAVTLATRLLGCTLVRLLDDGTRLAGRIVETEAYLGETDRAAHSFGGRRTPRTEPMFGRAGLAYVYFTYGMHHCFNVVAGVEGRPAAVLVRALEPLDAKDEMLARRVPGARRETDLCSGPGKLCQALAIDRGFSGVDLTAHRSLFIEIAREVPEASDIANTPRIGVDSAGQWATAPLRWFIRKSQHVSASRAEENHPAPAREVLDSIRSATGHDPATNG